MEKPYYSFHLKGWHFIVLDGNSYRDEHGDLVDYNFGKYFETTDLPYLGEQQLVWLREEVLSATEPIVIFRISRSMPALADSEMLTTCRRLSGKAEQQESGFSSA